MFECSLFFYISYLEKHEKERDGKEMIKFGKGVVKHRVLILIISFALLIPAAFGYFNTRVNYDILSYLPGELESMKGQDILVDEFGTGAFSLCVIEGMEDKDISTLREQIADVDHVKSVIWYDSLADLSVPMDVLPDEIYDIFNNDESDSTLMAILFDTSMSADETMDAIEEIRGITTKQCYLSGMSAVVTDIKDLTNKEVPFYVLIAVLLSVLVLSLTMDSAIIPLFFLLSIGMAIVYNLGSNVIKGEFPYGNAGVGGSLTAWCYHGLLHFSVAQLSGESGTVSGR